mgnify:CR=1 FL=1
MTDQGKKYLSDVLFAIELIEEFVKTTKDFNDFMLDMKNLKLF